MLAAALMLSLAFIARPPVEFTGGRYGVSARVRLNRQTRVAEVDLRGLPLGGSVSGTAWQTDSNETKLSAPLGDALRKRGVRLGGVVDEGDSLRVLVGLPVVGMLEIRLQSAPND